MERPGEEPQQRCADRPKTPALVRNKHTSGSVGSIDVAFVTARDASAGLPDDGKSGGMIPWKLQFDRVVVEHLPLKHDGKAAAHVHEVVLHHETQFGKVRLYFGLLLFVKLRIVTLPRHAFGSQGRDGVATAAARRRISTRATFSCFSVFPKTACHPDESICSSVRFAAAAS